MGHSVAPDGPLFVSWRQIHDEARAVGAALQAKGLLPGDHVAILGPDEPRADHHRPRLLAGRHRLDGAAAADADGFARGVRRVDPGRIRHGDAKLVLIDDQLAAFYAAGAGRPADRADGQRAARGRRACRRGDALEIPPHDPERLVILQYTSGSTSEPKGVMIPDRVLAANIDACCEAAELSRGEVMVSWLPLYHDMGLVGFLVDPDDDRRAARAGRAAGLPRQARQLDAVDLRLAVARPPPARTSPGCWRPGRCGRMPTASTCRR